MSKRLYVGNLPFSVTQEDLAKLFSAYGEVTEATVITNKFSGRSKGFGFVTLADDAGADKAISEMNGKDVQGRTVVVNEAKPFDPNAAPPKRDFGRGGGRGGFGGNRGGFGGNRRREGRRDSEEEF